LLQVKSKTLAPFPPRTEREKRRKAAHSNNGHITPIFSLRLLRRLHRLRHLVQPEYTCVHMPCTSPPSSSPSYSTSPDFADDLSPSRNTLISCKTHHKSLHSIPRIGAQLAAYQHATESRFVSHDPVFHTRQVGQIP